MNQRVVLKPTHLEPPPRRRKKKKSNRLWKGLFVIIFSTGLTTLAIHASDTFKNPGNTLLAGVGGANTPIPHCPSDMVYVSSGERSYCVDRYEVSAGDKCPRSSPLNQFDTQTNLTSKDCEPVSKAGNTPWVNVPLHDALLLCAKVGKRLPTNKEWYRAALGTPDAVTPNDPSACALGRTGQSESDPSGEHANCISSYGAYDMVGNVWEWVDGEVENGAYGTRELPQEGFIDEVDVEGVPTRIATTSNISFGEDYFFIDRSGVRGMIRGGFWSLKEKSGIYTINATIPTSFIGNAVGFRCAKDAQ